MTLWLVFTKVISYQQLQKDRFNSIMSPIQTCMEWGYGKIVQYWAFVDFKKQMKYSGSG
jgi:hypothetical protein